MGVGRWAFVPRILLWPILWWGFGTEALYCDSEPFEPAPVPLALDLSRVSLDDIARTVRHLQVIVRASEARARDLEAALALEHVSHLAALAESAKVQTALDADRAQLAKLTAELAIQTRWKWRWFKLWLGTVLLVAAFFIARQYVPFLRLL